MLFRSVTFVAAGPCTIAADQAGNGSFLAAPEATQSFTIVKQAQTITFASTAPSLPLVGSSYVVSATASSELAVSVTSLTTGTCTLAGNTVTFVAAGPCTIAANQSGNSLFLPAPERSQTITVITAAQAVVNLMTTINTMGLTAGEATSLSATLNNINMANLNAACGKLNAFVNKVNADAASGRLSAGAATQLLQAAKAIQSSAGCP